MSCFIFEWTQFLRMGADVRQHVVLLLSAAPPTVISVKIKPIQQGEEVGAHIYRSLEYGVSFQRAENGPESLPCFRLQAWDSGGLAVAEEGAGPRRPIPGLYGLGKSPTSITELSHLEKHAMSPCGGILSSRELRWWHAAG